MSNKPMSFEDMIQFLAGFFYDRAVSRYDPAIMIARHAYGYDADYVVKLVNAEKRKNELKKEVA